MPAFYFKNMIHLIKNAVFCLISTSGAFENRKSFFALISLKKPQTFPLILCIGDQKKKRGALIEGGVLIRQNTVFDFKNMIPHIFSTCILVTSAPVFS